MNTAQKTELNSFLYEVQIIDPLAKIIENLKNGFYKDSDVSYLNTKLDAFCELALKILGKNIVFKADFENTLNNHNRSRYLKYFNILLSFFKQY